MKRLIPIVLTMLAFSLSVSSQTQSASKGSGKASKGNGTPLEALAEARENGPVRDGIADLRAGKYEEAAREFNRALSQTPNVSALHVLTGVAYHLASTHGKPAMVDLAETGYLVAAQLDPTNYLAELQLGRLYLDTRRYPAAQQAFGRVLDMEHDSAEASYGLAVASYYARDLDSAVSAIRLTERLRPQDTEVQRASALIWSSVGMQGNAGNARAKYAALEADSERVRLLDRRIDQWRELIQSPTVQLAMLAPEMAMPSPAAQAPSTSGPVASHWGDCGGQLVAPPVNSGGNIDDLSPLPALPSPCVGRPMPRMAMIDAAIIRTEESVDSSRGINLLEGLQLVFGGSRTSTLTEGNGSSTKTITTTRSVGLPQAGVTYSLNIANATELRTDVLARPTLVALDRVPSQFFTGSNLSIAIPGQLSGGNLVEKPIGVSLAVTPTFIDDDSMLINVKAGRSDVEVGAAGSFDQALQTARNVVTANVIMRFDQTLILSGMHERETVMSKSGVPILREVPVIQYLFSSAVSEERQKSILITLTPRRPTLTSQATTRDPVGERPLDALGAELRERLTRDYTLPPNALSIVRSLSSNRYVQQFRTGDLREDDWRTQRSLDNFLRTLLRFLYY